jgi:hypothetical protein
MYDNETENGNFVLTRVFLVDIKSDEIPLDLVRRACAFWARRHPFLRAKIHRTDNYLERYFVELDESDAFKFDNVQVLDEAESSARWLEIMDSEIVTRFDMDKDPLWKLKFVRLAKGEVDLNYNYAMILTTQHSIGDGRNCYEIGVQLLNILGALLEGKVCGEMSDVVEESLFTSEELFAQKAIKFELEVSGHDELNRSPKAFNSQVDQPHGRLQYFCLDAVKMKKLLAKVKSSSKCSKLTSVLGAILSLALRNLYEKHNADDVPRDKFQSVILASTRDKYGISNTQMGVYSCAVHGTYFITEQLSADFDNSNFDRFWSVCDEQSASLAGKLKRNEEFTFYAEMDELIEALRDISKFSEKNLHFALSNIGVMRNTSCTDTVRIREHYVRMPCITGRIAENPFVGVTSIDGNLCIALSHNENVLNSAVMTELVAEMQRLIDLIIQ